MNAVDLILIRSDQGDGGWSLHTPRQLADAEANDEAPDCIISGPADWDEQSSDWNRPNAADYERAQDEICVRMRANDL